MTNVLETCLLNNIKIIVNRLYCLSKSPSLIFPLVTVIIITGVIHSSNENRKDIDFGYSFIQKIVDLPSKWLYKQDYLRVFLNTDVKTQVLTVWSLTIFVFHAWLFISLASNLLVWFHSIGLWDHLPFFTFNVITVCAFGSRMALGLSLVSRGCLILDKV